MSQYFRRRTKLKGLTLLEMIISIGVFVLVATATTVIFDRSLVAYRASTDKNEAAQQAAIAAEWLVRDIQTAYAIIIAEADEIAVVSPDLESPPNLRYIHYYLDAEDPTIIQRKECAGQEYLLAEGVTQFSFKYYDINNQVLSDPANNLLSLRAVEIDITTEEEDEEFKLNTVVWFDYNPEYQWAKAYGGTDLDELNSLQQTDDDGDGDTDDGYILGGKTQSFGDLDGDFLAIKTDPSGTIQWAKTYGGVNLDEINSLQASDGGYILGGYTESFGGGGEFMAMETNSEGDVTTVAGGAVAGTWAKAYGGLGADELNYLQALEVGPILGGYTLSFGTGGEFMVIKADPNGDVTTVGGGAVAGTWANAYGGLGADELNCLRAIAGGYTLGGSTESFGQGAAGSPDFLLIMTDSGGVVTEARAHGGTGVDELNCLQAIDEGYILGGYTESFGTGGEFMVIKTNSTGDVTTDGGGVVADTWAWAYGGTNLDQLNFLQAAPGGYILGGYTESFGAGEGTGDFLLIKINPNGVVDWARAYGGSGVDELNCLQAVTGGSILGGETTSDFEDGTKDKDFLLIKPDSSGDLVCCGIWQDVTSSISVTDLTIDPSFAVADPTLSINTADLTTDPNFSSNDLTTNDSFTTSGVNPTTTLICPSP